MNNLTIIENEGKRVLTTTQLAEGYGTDYKIISNNFNRNKTRYILGKHYFVLGGEEKREFINYHNFNDSSKNAKQLYLWTEKGALLHAKSLNTDKAWDVYEKLVENYFNPKTDLPVMSKELRAILMLDQKTVEIDNRITKLENTMTIDYSQQECLNRCARARLIEILGGKDSKAYKELSKKIFSSLWNMYKLSFNVNSYKNTAKKDYDRALDFICSWEPSKEMQYMIIGANTQMQFN